MTANEIKALRIGVTEAYNNNAIVPATSSQEMTKLMRELRDGLIPIIKAYNIGLALKLTIQLRLGIIPPEMKEQVSALFNM